MTVGEWLNARTPAPPERLRGALREALGPALAADAALAGAATLDAAERLLQRTLAAGCRARSDAVGLLVADALVTYAFEAAADEPESLGERAAQAVRRLAGLAAAPAAGRGEMEARRA